MTRVLIDTDVVMDFFLDREPFATHSAKILELCLNKKIKGHVTSVIIANLYYLLRKVSAHQKVTESLKELVGFIDILSIDKRVILTALESNFKDFEDALQNYAAESSGKIDFIITRNIKDYKKSAIGVLSPSEFLKQL